MSSDRKRPSPLNKNALRQLVRIALDRGYYIESYHAAEEHKERNISADDVIHGLERSDWVVDRSPDYDENRDSWEYLIRTVDIEGEELHIKIAAYPADQRIVIISRW